MATHDSVSTLASRSLFSGTKLNDEDDEDDDSYFYFDLDEYLTSVQLKKKRKKKKKSSILALAIIESYGKYIQHNKFTEEDKRLFYCRIRYGTEKRKTKIGKAIREVVTWQELFTFCLSDEPKIDIDLWDRDHFYGRATVIIDDLQLEKTHKMDLEIYGGSAKHVSLVLLVTISGTELNRFEEQEEYLNMQKQLNSSFRKFRSFGMLGNWDEVGFLTVFIYGSKGLPKGGEYYCVVQLGYNRLQTHIDYRNSNQQQWMKLCNFVVTDVASILVLTVWDDKKDEEVAKLKIRLININNRQRKWYALKDLNMRDPAKGENARILLEIRFSYNLVKSSYKLISPLEKAYLDTPPKFDRQTLSRNWYRVKDFWNFLLEVALNYKSAFQWDSHYANLSAILGWILFCWNFKQWMMPFIVVIPFFWYKKGHFLIHWQTNFGPDDKTAAEKAKSIRKRITNLQELVQNVQNGIGKIASYSEKVKNLFNFTVPFISVFAIFMLFVSAFILYFVPLRFIFILWALKRYVKRILLPFKRSSPNQILSLIRRIPDDELLFETKEFPLEETDDDEFEDYVTYLNKRTSGSSAMPDFKLSIVK